MHPGPPPAAYLAACGLPGAWAGQRQWRILDTHAGSALHLLAAWRAWKDDPHRPGVLHAVGLLAFPPCAEDLVRAAAQHPELSDLARTLAAQWWGLLPGVHRLALEGGQVLFTLLVGNGASMLQELAHGVDTVLLHGPDAPSSQALLKPVARLCGQGTRIVLPWAQRSAVLPALAPCGFRLLDDANASEPGPWRAAEFAPAWTPKGQRPREGVAPARCTVVGAGLAGAAVAASLARRGWQVTVLDAAIAPAAGASGLPAGLLAPHLSPDDNLLSRLSRSGVRITLAEAATRFREGADWAPTGTLELRERAGVPALHVQGFEADWHAWASQAQVRTAGLPAGAAAVWHPHAAWVRPAALVRAWLSQPGVQFVGNARVASCSRTADGQWVVHDAAGQPMAQSSMVVLAAALGSAALAGGKLWLNPVRGQVSWSPVMPRLALPPSPVNGNGHFLPRVPLPEGVCWITGSTYGRGDDDAGERAADHAANLDRLSVLLPGLAGQLAPQFAAGPLGGWSGVRCTSSDRRPLLGEIEPGLWVSTAMGSRGLTFAVLCAELLAARLHAEPLPVAARLAQALDVQRQLAA